MRSRFALIRLVIISVLLSGLAACGGSSNSGGGEDLAQNRQAADCVEFGDGTVINLCNFAIIVRTFAGSSTPVSVPANGVAIDPDGDVSGSFGACEAPFTPVEVSAIEFECL